MGDTKETKPSRHNKTDIDMKSPDWQNAHSLNRSKPDGVPVLGGDERPSLMEKLSLTDNH